MIAQFDRDVSDWVQRLLDVGVYDFDVIVKSLPGVDPFETKRCLASKRFPVTSSKMDGERWDKQRPVPHPLDYDWRFHQDALAQLSTLIVQKGKDGSKVGLLGCPTLFQYLKRGLSYPGADLFDRNAHWCTVVDPSHHFVVDFSKSDPPIERVEAYDVLVIDPPWYKVSYESFMRFGRKLIKPQGIIIVSVLPIGTRPSAGDDRNQILRDAQGQGLELVEELDGVLKYWTPPFERNAIVAAGLSFAGLESWRSADAWLFRAKDGNWSDNSSPLSEDLRWLESTFGHVRVRFDSTRAHGPTELRSLIRGDILPTVSTRHPLRARASVWTSGNRIFDCENAKMLHHLLESVEFSNGQFALPEHVCNEDMVALVRILEVIRVEMREY